MSETTAQISPHDTVNAIVDAHPELLGVLSRMGIDTCCGGALPLETVAERHGFDLEALLETLREAAAA